MRIKNAFALRSQLARQKQWLTTAEIAAGLGMHRNTVQHMLRLRPVSAATVRRVAEAIGKEPLEIAEFVVED
jgi:predicted transcriptional regulator